AVEAKLYQNVVNKIDAHMVGRGRPPEIEEVELWRQASQARIVANKAKTAARVRLKQKES
ncbi:MAG: hypothetical protein JWQ72_3651, partial [Polaromonas sp.]|nr:hypothetical protein [Polaromonas sp.]